MAPARRGLAVFLFLCVLAVVFAPSARAEVYAQYNDDGVPDFLLARTPADLVSEAKAFKASPEPREPLVLPAPVEFTEIGPDKATLRLVSITADGLWQLEVSGKWHYPDGTSFDLAALPDRDSTEAETFVPTDEDVFLMPHGQKLDLQFDGLTEERFGQTRYLMTLLNNYDVKDSPALLATLQTSNLALVFDGVLEFDFQHPIKPVMPVDWWVIIGYMVLMLIIGFLVAGRNKGGSDYFKGGSHMPWWLGGVSLFMSCFSTYTFVGGAGAAYDKIVLALILYFCNLSGFAFGYIILAARWRRTRSLTTMQYLEERYGDATHQLFSWIDVVTGFFYAASWLLTLTVIVAASLDLSKPQIIPAILIIGAVIVVYTVVGGFWAVCLTDMLQFIVLLPIVLVLAYVSLMAVGGFGTIVANAPARFFSATELPSEGYRDTLFIVANLVMMVFAFSSGGAAQRYFAVRNESGAKKVALLTGILFIFGPVIWFIPPMVASYLAKTGQMSMIELMPGKPLAECSYVLMCRRLLPTGLIGLVLAAMFAATMSSIDTAFNWRGAILTRDIIQKLFMPKATDRTLLLIGRLVTFFMGAAVIGICIWMYLATSSIFQLMFDLGAFILIPAGVPIVFGLIWPHTRKWSAFYAYLVGLLLGLGKFLVRAESIQNGINNLIARLSENGSPDHGLAWLVRWLAAFFGMDTGIQISYGLNVIVIGAVVALIYFLPGILALLFPSVFGEKDQEYLARVKKFFVKMHTPIDEDKEVGPVTAGVSSFALTGVLTIIIGVGVFVLYAFSPDKLILWTGGMTVLIGVLIWAAGRFAKEKG